MSQEQICSIDLFPTIAAAAGVPVAQPIDGVDLLPALKGGSLEPRALYWHYPHYSNQGGMPGGAIRIGDYKLVERYEDGRAHLYNLKEDIGEQNDLAAEQPERADQLRAQLHKWYKTVNAQFLRPLEKGSKPWRP